MPRFLNTPIHGSPARKFPYDLLVQVALGAALAVVCVSALLQPLMDNDFFWHLKTGEWIWDHKALILDEDPFSYTAPRPLGPAQRFSTTAYWLSQVLLHAVEAAAGLGGIVVLKVGLFLLLLWVMWLRREGDRAVYLALLTLMAFALATFPFERPQAFSFLGFAALLGLLDRVGSSRGEGLFSAGVPGAVVALMLVWANMHPAFVLGVAAICLRLAEILLRRGRSPIKWEGRSLARVWATLAAAVGVTLLNPNGWRVLQILRLPDWMTVNNMEYMSTIAVYRTVGSKTVVGYWLLLGVTALVAAAGWRVVTMSEAALLLGTGYFSFVQIRYVPFFLIVALPVAGRCLGQVRIANVIRPTVVVLALVAGSYMMVAWKPRAGPFLQGRWVNSYTLPVGAAEFVLSADLRGRMYNDFSWGGYLIWRLGPGRRVFTDGRNLSRVARSESLELESGSAERVGGRFPWERIFDEWGVNWVVAPVFSNVGNLVPLTFYLQGDKGWDTVFVGGNAAIMVRHEPENSAVIRRFAIDKLALARDLLMSVERHLERAPRQRQSLIARGDLLVRLGRIPEARQAYVMAAESSPGDPLPLERLRMLEGGAPSAPEDSRGS